MKRAALGVRMHSGWGVVVGACAEGGSVEVIVRRRIVVIDPKIPGAKQPYHHAAQFPTSRPKSAREMGHPTSLEPSLQNALSARELSDLGVSDPGLAEAEKYLADCAGASERLALAAVGDVVRELERRGYGIAGCAVLVGAGRRLPGLGKILGSHPLIHTAEGEFFRDAVMKACAGLGIPVTAIPESEVGERVKTAFGKTAGGVEHRISSMGKSIGPPWTKDHKTAALGAVVVLGEAPRT
jgi:hypothetical protein